MSVVSYSFFAFLAIAVLLYYVVPKKLQWVVLLGASIYFYAMAGVQFLAVVLLTAVVVYFLAMLMQKNLDKQAQMVQGMDRKAARAVKNDMKAKRKKILVLALVIVIGVLFVFKASGFCITNINRLLGMASMAEIPDWNLIAPLGISFYSFMMISYLMDVYNGKAKAQKNFLKYLTYVLYFPHVTQGPIAKYDEVAPQIFSEHRFSYDTVTQGLWLMMWGYFRKLVIADRLSSLVIIRARSLFLRVLCTRSRFIAISPDVWISCAEPLSVLTSVWARTLSVRTFHRHCRNSGDAGIFRSVRSSGNMYSIRYQRQSCSSS